MAVIVRKKIDSKVLGATLLIAGVSIGTGMLGMPIVTGLLGFVPSLGIMTLTWAAFLLSGFLIADVNIHHSGNLVAMAEKTLGRGGKLFTRVTYLFLLYALDIAFLAAGGKILGTLFPLCSYWVFPLLITLPLGCILLSGMRAVDHVNRWLVMGKLVVGYGLIVWLVPPHVQMHLLNHVDLYVLPLALPVVAQAFGFHTVIPSIVDYLDKDSSKIRLSLVLGTVIGFVVYVFWEFLVLGVVPFHTIQSTYLAGGVATIPLIEILQSPLIVIGANIFALCGIATAFLGVTLGLMGSLSDTFKGLASRKWQLMIVAFLPPILCVYVSPSIFLLALKYAGILIAILLGLLPMAMAWKLPHTSYWKQRNGRWLMCAGAVFFMAVIACEVFNF